MSTKKIDIRTIPKIGISNIDVNGTTEPVTAVSRNCEFCGKFTFAFRKNFYL